MGPGGPMRPGGPVPPRDPAYPPSPGQGGGTGRHAGGPGYAAPGGRRPGTPGYAPGPGHAGAPGYGGAPGHAGAPGPAEAAGQFNGGYATVIRASDSPVRPAGPARPASFGRPPDPARPSDSARPRARADEAPADVYVYRDTSGQPDDPAAAVRPAESDAAYWYDLPGTGTRGPEGLGVSGGGAPHAAEEARGPFEPLVSSADPPGTTPRSAASPGAAEPAAPAPDAVADGPQDTAHARARKLEQIRDFYLTAEAIGEANVDKHFDQLLAQQRELISEYFKQSGPARTAGPEGPAGQAGAAPEGPGGPAGDSESTRVTADQPRVW